jgi:hypothetical protein
MGMNDLTQLRKIQNIVSELGYESSLLSESETGSLDMILVKFQNNKHEVQSLAISFMPLNDELESSLFIQFYYEYPFLLKTPCPNELKTLIQNVNRQLPLGHFNTNVAWNQIYFKYVLALSKEGSFLAGHLSDILDMILFPIPHFENEFSDFKQD